MEQEYVKKINVNIPSATASKLNEMWKDDSNRIAVSKASKGDLVDLGLQLLFQARKTKSLEQIYYETKGGVIDEIYHQ